MISWRGEGEHGSLPAGAFVAMNSGWEARIGDPALFINAGEDGVLHFSGFHPDAAAFLVDE